jgi:hypothetical protein
MQYTLIDHVKVSISAGEPVHKTETMMQGSRTNELIFYCANAIEGTFHG